MRHVQSFALSLAFLGMLAVGGTVGRAAEATPDYLAMGLSPSGSPLGWSRWSDSPAHQQPAPEVGDSPDYFSRYGVEAKVLDEVLVKGMVRNGGETESVACVLQVGQSFVPRAATRFGTILDVTAESRVERAPGCPVGLRGVTTSPMIGFSRAVPPALADEALRHHGGEELWKRARELSLVNPAFAPAGFDMKGGTHLDAKATVLPPLPVERLPAAE